MADVLLLSRYERLGASSRVRSYQFLDALAAAGISVAVCPLFDDDYVRARHGEAGVPIGNIAAAYARRVRDALTNRNAAVVWLEYELPPPCPILKVVAPRLPQEALNPVSFLTGFCDALIQWDRREEAPPTPLWKKAALATGLIVALAFLVSAGRSFLPDFNEGSGG